VFEQGRVAVNHECLWNRTDLSRPSIRCSDHDEKKPKRVQGEKKKTKSGVDEAIGTRRFGIQET